MLYFTSDQHFGSAYPIEVHRRPFDSYEEFEKISISNINSRVTDIDTLYVVGDWLNYSKHVQSDWEHSLDLVKHINCKCKLITGNNEQRLIQKKFRGDILSFESYCKRLGWECVLTGAYVKIRGNRLYCVHNPLDIVYDCLNLFGHIHRLSMLTSFGLNVGCDVHNYLPVSEDDVRCFISRMKKYCILEQGHRKAMTEPIRRKVWDNFVDSY